ncbi:MAG: hypothetical protein EHM23_30640 [Acidobacteria bacterium]|nr:MAG: hypothetical protein EHM23_34620 [Acidobacteriota bacterium]RPJ53597.1 MAG: hypothetical protein EHM23_30640 [Acidobacteriota bacterium]
MRRTILSALVAIVMCFLPVTAADVYRYDGRLAQASYNMLDENNIYTGVYVIGRDTLDQTRPGKPEVGSTVSIYIVVFDDTNTQTLLEASGQKDLSPEEFKIKANLGGATLKTFLDVYDAVSQRSVTAEIDIEFVATGKAIRATNHAHSHPPEGFFNVRSVGVGRVAVATGSIILGGENLTPEPSDFADMYEWSGFQVANP